MKIRTCQLHVGVGLEIVVIEKTAKLMVFSKFLLTDKLFAAFAI
ncbi:hypothetical protein ABN324_03465 [Providencia alcalifaciens]|nr:MULTISPECIES: hypothetical protein [Providencia]